MQRRSFIRGCLVTLAGAFALPGRLLSAVKEGVVIHVSNGKETFVIPVGKWGLKIKIVHGGEIGPMHVSGDEGVIVQATEKQPFAAYLSRAKNGDTLLIFNGYQGNQVVHNTFGYPLASGKFKLYRA